MLDKDICELGERIDVVDLAGLDQGRDTAQCSAPPSDPLNSAFLRLSLMPRLDRSTVLLSSSMRHDLALRALHALAADDRTISMMQKLVHAGVGFEACVNTMGVKLDDLTPGFVAAKRGRVAWAELQQQGYADLRP
jgi:hypothetical protein